MAKAIRNYTGQVFNKTVYVNGVKTINPQISIGTNGYTIDRYEFDKIINYKSALEGIATTLLGATIGLFINMVAKLIGHNIDESIKFDSWEFYAFFITFLLMGIFYGIDYLVPNEKKRIIKVISEHFTDKSNN